MSGWTLFQHATSSPFRDGSPFTLTCLDDEPILQAVAEQRRIVVRRAARNRWLEHRAGLHATPRPCNWCLPHERN